MENGPKMRRRRWLREPVQLQAHYFIKDQSTRYQSCTLINISRGGAGVLFPPYEYLKARVLIFVELLVPKSFQQLTLRGQLKGKYRSGAGLVGGIQFSSLLEDDLLSRLL